MTELYCYNLEIYEIDSGKSRKVFAHSFTPGETLKVMQAINSYSYREWFGDTLLKLSTNSRAMVEHELNLKQMVENYQANLVHMALLKTGGNKKAAAKLLKANRTTLIEISKRYGLNDIDHTSPTCAGYVLHVVDSLEEKLKQSDVDAMSEGELEHMLMRVDRIKATAAAKLRSLERSQLPQLRAVNES